MILDRLSAEKLTKYATQAAVALASTLFVLKLIAWISTGSDTLKLSCFDSGFDIVVSSTNLLIITLIINKQNPNFVFGYDKIAALAALSQVLMMVGIITYTLLGTLSFEVPQYNIYSISILFLSLILSFMLIKFQKYVSNRTNSIIVKADMLHYQTDLFINAVSIVCLIISKFYAIWWLDAALAILIGLYLLKNISHLCIESLNILLDRKLPHNEIKHIKDLLHNYKIKNLHVIFSGMREIISFDILYSPNTTLDHVEKDINAIDKILKDQKNNKIINIKPTIDSHTNSVS